MMRDSASEDVKLLGRTRDPGKAAGSSEEGTA